MAPTAGRRLAAQPDAILVTLTGLSCLRPAFLLVAAFVASAQPSVLLDAMSQELNRNFNILKEKADPPPYFMSYEVTESEFTPSRETGRHRFR